MNRAKKQAAKKHRREERQRDARDRRPANVSEIARVGGMMIDAMDRAEGQGMPPREVAIAAGLGILDGLLREEGKANEANVLRTVYGRHGARGLERAVGVLVKRADELAPLAREAVQRLNGLLARPTPLPPTSDGPKPGDTIHTNGANAEHVGTMTFDVYPPGSEQP